MKTDNKSKTLDVKKILLAVNQGPNKWELDNVIYSDRATNPKTLLSLLNRVQTLETLKKPSENESKELEILYSLVEDLDETQCLEILSNDDETAKHNFIESLARKSALEVLTSDRVSFETMELMCKLCPDDFILVSKRTQDLINAIHELVIQGETLSKEMGGA